MAGKFVLKCGRDTYTLELDDANRIHQLKVNVMQIFAESYDRERINRETLRNIFKYLLIADPEQFAELYKLLQQNDPVMFESMENLACEMRDFLLKLTDK